MPPSTPCPGPSSVVGAGLVGRATMEQPGPPAGPQRWWIWVPVLGLGVQLVRARRGVEWLEDLGDRPAHRHLLDFLEQEEAELLVTRWVTGFLLLVVVLAILAWQLVPRR